ncbi:HalOD1 output domain-containing protein [Halorarum salinum]|uniref:Uncharacterized protein n=1 Tax=Halorarum salinum TaxID=2743089 RepID=A0A7D5L903_9EURY|nr:HalOD1 output domain-containing protein [Halobaculum salinum]QLG60914.1 hypothetical protein HUG12_03815 [Halobaculum salinum]
MGIGPLFEDESSLLVAYSLDGDESMSEATVEAFIAANVDVFDRETTLHDWIDPDALDRLDWRSDRPMYLLFPLWDHLVLVTPGKVRIYTGP